jgi:hypothetical protein
MLEFVLFGGAVCIAYLTILNLIRLRRYNRERIERVEPGLYDLTD